MTADLLALLVELTSVTAAGQQIKKPITLPRPHDNTPRPQQPQGTGEGHGDGYQKGIAVLAATSRAVARR